MSNENVLLFLYEKLFPTDVDRERSPNPPQKQKPSFNFKVEPIPMLLKTKISKRIKSAKVEFR